MTALARAFNRAAAPSMFIYAGDSCGRRRVSKQFKEKENG
jgi:hypothetical protein